MKDHAINLRVESATVTCVKSTVRATARALEAVSRASTRTVVRFLR